MLIARIDRFPIAGSFTISRGAKTEAVTVVAEISLGGGLTGRGECVPYPRYGEAPETTLAAGAATASDRRAGAAAARMPPTISRVRRAWEGVVMTSPAP